jgi:hypothetical protein
MEMDAENNEDESYYISQSPVRRGAAPKHPVNKSSALSNNPSNFGDTQIAAQPNPSH